MPFILLILGNDVIILNYTFVLEREKEIVLLQRSRLHAKWVAVLLTSGKCYVPEGMGLLKCCETCVGKNPFLRGVLSGPVEIDGFQNRPRHSSLSHQTFDV